MALVFRGRRGRGGGFRGRSRGRGRGHAPARKTFSPEKTRLCQVCKVDDLKYRCPQCSVQYCSVKCFKDHKPKCLVDDLDIENEPEDWKPVANPALAELAAHERRLAIKRGEAREDGEIELFSSESESEEEREGDMNPDCNPDRLGKKDLKKLANSSKLKELLANPHLRNLILEVDGAEDKNSIMQAAMQEPLFNELTDACLEAVEKKND